MSFLKIKIHLKKYNDLIFIEKIRCDSRDEFYYLPPESQFLCLHTDLSLKLKEFKKFTTVEKVLKYPHYLKYYDINSSSLKFKNIYLLSENDYKKICNLNLKKNLELFNFHLSCANCKLLSIIHESKIIKKRKKLTIDEKIQCVCNRC